MALPRKDTSSTASGPPSPAGEGKGWRTDFKLLLSCRAGACSRRIPDRQENARTTPSVILSGAPLDPATGMWRLRFDYGLRPSHRITRGRNRTPQVQPQRGWDLDGAMFSPSATDNKSPKRDVEGAIPYKVSRTFFKIIAKPLPSPAGEGVNRMVDG